MLDRAHATNYGRPRFHGCSQVGKPTITGRSDKVRKAATTGRRSVLYRWMLENYAEFTATVAEAGRPNWAALAEMFGNEGLHDRLGRPPSPETARQTWWLVRQAVARSGGKAAQTPQASAQPPPAGRPTLPDAPLGETDFKTLGGTRFSFRATSDESERARLIGRSDKPK